MDAEVKQGLTVASFSIFVVLGLIILGMWGCPRYRVYSQEKEGQALLAHAQSSKEIAVAEARAKKESAALLADADTIRARGIAASNRIIGQSLENNPAYLQWLWIDELKQTSNQIIYIPSGQMGMPILEANRLQFQMSGGQVTSFRGQPGPITERK